MRNENDKSRWPRIIVRIFVLLLALIGALAFFLITVSGYIDNPTRSRAERVRADLRSIQLALETYYIDYNAYPAWAVGKAGQNGLLPPDDPAFSVPTFASADIPGQLRDPFSKAGYAYWAGDCKRGWIVYSPGPDNRYDVDPAADYVPGSAAPAASLIHKSYDPTNGTESAGDIWKIKD